MSERVEETSGEMPVGDECGGMPVGDDSGGMPVGDESGGMPGGATGGRRTRTREGDKILEMAEKVVTCIPHCGPGVFARVDEALTRGFKLVELARRLLDVPIPNTNMRVGDITPNKYVLKGYDKIVRASIKQYKEIGSWGFYGWRLQFLLDLYKQAVMLREYTATVKRLIHELTLLKESGNDMVSVEDVLRGLERTKKIPRLPELEGQLVRQMPRTPPFIPSAFVDVCPCHRKNLLFAEIAQCGKKFYGQHRELLSHLPTSLHDADKDEYLGRATDIEDKSSRLHEIYSGIVEEAESILPKAERAYQSQDLKCRRTCFLQKCLLSSTLEMIQTMEQGCAPKSPDEYACEFDNGKSIEVHMNKRNFSRYESKTHPCRRYVWPVEKLTLHNATMIAKMNARYVSEELTKQYMRGMDVVTYGIPLVAKAMVYAPPGSLDPVRNAYAPRGLVETRDAYNEAYVEYTDFDGPDCLNEMEAYCTALAHRDLVEELAKKLTIAQTGYGQAFVDQYPDLYDCVKEKEAFERAWGMLNMVFNGNIGEYGKKLQMKSYLAQIKFRGLRSRKARYQLTKFNSVLKSNMKRYAEDSLDDHGLEFFAKRQRRADERAEQMALYQRNREANMEMEEFIRFLDAKNATEESRQEKPPPSACWEKSPSPTGSPREKPPSIPREVSRDKPPSPSLDAQPNDEPPEAGDAPLMITGALRNIRTSPDFSDWGEAAAAMGAAAAPTGSSPEAKNKGKRPRAMARLRGKLSTGVPPTLRASALVLPPESADELPEAAPAETAEKLPEAAPAETAEKLPEAAPAETAEKLPEAAPAETAEKLPEAAPAETAEKLPEAAPAETAEKLPEAAPAESVEKPPEAAPAEESIPLVAAPAAAPVAESIPLVAAPAAAPAASKKRKAPALPPAAGTRRSARLQPAAAKPPDEFVDLVSSSPSPAAEGAAPAPPKKQKKRPPPILIYTHVMKEEIFGSDSDSPTDAN